MQVRRGLTDVGGVLAFEDLKTTRSFRTVPMADLALEKLREHIDTYVNSDDDSALLLPGVRGAPTPEQLAQTPLRSRRCAGRTRSPVAP